MMLSEQLRQSAYPLNVIQLALALAVIVARSGAREPYLDPA
jgi:hypothetical protein